MEAIEFFKTAGLCILPLMQIRGKRHNMYVAFGHEPIALALPLIQCHFEAARRVLICGSYLGKNECMRAKSTSYIKFPM